LFFAHNNRRGLKSKLQFTNKLKLIPKKKPEFFLAAKMHKMHKINL